MADIEQIEPEAPPPPIPKLHVQRMGKKYRIVYEETRCLAKFNSGTPLDGGGFTDEYEDGKKTVDGQMLARQKMSVVIGNQSVSDPEAEIIGT